MLNIIKLPSLKSGNKTNKIKEKLSEKVGLTGKISIHKILKITLLYCSIQKFVYINVSLY